MGSSDLKKLTNMELTSAEELKDASSPIQVITQKDINNSGVKILAEALRLAPNLQIVHVNFRAMDN